MPGIAVGIAVKIGGRIGTIWSSEFYILKSGAIWYKRETNTDEGYFKLHYSDDSGATWEELFTLDVTEDSVIIDAEHEYVHAINGTSYEVRTTEGEVLYST